MSEEMNNELMTIESEESTNSATDNYSEANGGSGKAIGMTMSLVIGLIGLGAMGYKKYKSKKSEEQPKKKKTKKRLKWVDVEETEESESKEEEDVVSEEIDDEATEE